MDIVYSKTGWSGAFGYPAPSQIIKKEKAATLHCSTKGGEYYVVISDGGCPIASIHVRVGGLGRMHAINIIDKRCQPMGFSVQMNFRISSNSTSKLMRLTQVVYTTPVVESNNFLFYQRFTQGVKEISDGRFCVMSNIIQLRKHFARNDWDRVWSSPMNEDADVGVDCLEFLPEPPFGGVESLLCLKNTPIPVLTNTGWVNTPFEWPELKMNGLA